MANKNKEKITTIKGYLAQANCAGVQVEWSRKDELKPLKLLTRDTVNFNGQQPLLELALVPEQEIEILGIKPIPIKLEALSDGDKVWVNGVIAEVARVDCGKDIGLMLGDFWYGDYPRHEILKVVD